MADLLQLSFLGTPQIKRDGVRMSKFTLRKSLALLCYLCLTQGEQPRALLANLLWSEYTEINARAGLRKVLAELRRELGSHVLITRESASFDRTSAYWLDVMAFEQFMLHLSGDLFESPTIEMIAELAGAVTYYRGDFLAGFQVYRAPVFEEWMRLQRERLRLQALRMLYVLAKYHFNQGSYPQATDYAEQLLVLEPYHEEALRLSMLLLARSGQQLAALRQYQAYNSRLEGELGLLVEKETIALYERIRSGKISRDSPLLPLPRRFLLPPNPLVGRQGELTEIIAMLQDPQCRLLTLVGAAGVGKTRLVQEIGVLFAAETARQETCLVPLGNMQTVDGCILAIVTALGMQLSPDQNPRQQLLDCLRSRQVLLILDGCESLPLCTQSPGESVEELVGAILVSSPDSKILVTSRVRLQLSWEHIYALEGMTYPEHLPDDLADLRSYDAVALFLWQRQRLQPDTEPSPAELQVIARACRLVSGSPLEILLLANRVCNLSGPPDCDSTCVFHDTRFCRETLHS
ncbi:MAG: NACHT domain-containing protein [Chloroflexi bacterium]|nr:NACHT domain-containing protein [Chloroflexota bacterium]